MEGETSESCQATTAQDRLKLIKEERRKQHEERLERSPLYTVGLLNEDSDTLKRFSKYRRSDRERLRKEVLETAPVVRSLGAELEQEVLTTDSSSDIPPMVDLSKECLWNVSPLYSSPSTSPDTLSSETLPQDVLKSNVPYRNVDTVSFRPNYNPSVLTSSLSLDQNKGVLKKPSIPPILRSATEPAPATTNDDEHVLVKKPSILKKKDDSSYPGISSSNSGPCASVSFGLPESKSMLTRTKSIDSNLSGDTETGYWSGGENAGGILKNRRQFLDGDHSDQSSILKLRRSSLGSSILSTGSEGGLQSILKRKLSYDSSYIMKEANNTNEYSFSTHSLPACGCLSPEPKPILKKKCSSEDLEEVEPKPILKHRTSRDYHDINVETERIKPCLKKSTSKSADETFPSPSHKWREPASTSNSSSSSEIDNVRSGLPTEREDQSFSLFHPSSVKDSSSDLQRAHRSFCSESDINTNENRNVTDSDCHPEQSSSIFHIRPDLQTLSNPSLKNAFSPTPYGDYRILIKIKGYDSIKAMLHLKFVLKTVRESDDTAVENGLASQDIERHQYPQPARDFTTRSTSSNNSTTTTSVGASEGKLSSEDDLVISSIFGPKKKISSVKTRSELGNNNLDHFDEPGLEPPKFKFNWRRNSIGSTNTNLDPASSSGPISRDRSKNQVDDFILGCTAELGPGKLKHQSLATSSDDGRDSVSETNHSNHLKGTGGINEANAMSSKIERTDSHEDIIMSLSVAEKRSLFMQLENERKSEARGFRKQGGGGSSSARGKRYTTQPVTTDEVEKAAKMMVQNQEPVSHGTKMGATTFSDSQRVKNDKSVESDNTNRKADDLMSSLNSKSFCEKINLNRDSSSPLISHKSVDTSSTPSASVNDHRKSWEGDECSSSSSDVHDGLSSSKYKPRSKETVESNWTSKPPSGAAFSRSRNRSSRDSYVARLNRITDSVNTRIESEGGTTPGTPSRGTMTVTKPMEVEQSDGEISKSLRDRIRMFNIMASATQSEYKAVTRKTVTSKRFNTQPAVCTARRLFEEYGNGAATSLPIRSHNDDASSCTHKKTMVSTASSGEDNKSTVRDKEGHYEDESECSQTLGAISADSVIPCSSRDKGINSDQEFDPDTQLSARSPIPTSSPVEMPEKILTGSDDSSSSYDEANSEFLDPDNISESYSCGRRRLSKSSSANSMMMSTETDVNLFQKSKMNRNSIAEKIAALQTNGEVGWKKRMVKINPDYPDKEKVVVPPTDQNDNVELRKNNKDSSVIANRLSQLESSQEKWKKRVGENDANIFTVQGRLEKAGKITRSVPESPVTPTSDHKVKGIKVLAPLRFRNTSETFDSAPSTASPNEGPKLGDLFNAPNPKVHLLAKQPRKYSRSETGSSSESSEEDKVTRSVSRNDNETFTSFFDPMLSLEKPTRSKALTATSRVQIDDSSFKAIQTDGRQLLGIRRNVKAPRNHSNVKNPIKSLALRLQEQSYVEVSPQVREKEMKKRINVENLAKNAQLSVEALAGLASKEDFTAVKLKKAGNERNTKEFPHPMLIRIKGKRQVQTRLVPPEVASLSSGDNYILVTANKLYQFIGEYSNRLERAKIADVVSHIVQKKDLGCRIASNTEVATLEEPLLGGGRDRTQFFQLLGGESVPETDDLGDELDEAYESGIVTTNRVFEVDEAKEELVPLLESGGWRCQPRHSLLQDDKVLVFDFGSEMYVWSGSKADPLLKKTANQLAKKLFDEGYDFEDIDPLCSPIGVGLKDSQRPSWCFLKKINQHMEPILFIEKFFDWPDDSGRLIKVQKQRSSDGSIKEANYNFTACDVNEMINEISSTPDPSLELEGFNVGRGTEVRNEEDRRVFTITTLDVKAWNISEFSKSEVDETSLGQFYSEETSVIRWQFSVSQIGRDLKGNMSRHMGVLGRERSTYFFWQGKSSKITEQGTSALMTVELDREKGPQVRVEQGREPPAFLNLFKGLMFIHLESKEAPLKDAKLYVVMGACENEGHFIEVQCESSSLRSLGSFLLADFLKGRLYLWHGKLSNPTSRKIAINGANKIIEAPHQYLNYHGSLRLIELEEGEESLQFLSCLNVQNKNKLTDSYACLKDRKPQDYAEVTVFGFSSLQGSFEATPVLSLKRKSDSPEAFPILQEELYSAQQPKLFLISRGRVTWLWHGWTPRGDEENENATTGSGEIRWTAERKAAIETAINFCQTNGTNGFVVHAGLEPPQFTNIFPYWRVVDEARESNLTEGKTVGLMTPLEEAREKFVNTRLYTLEELQERPEEVDHSKLETYLSDEDFENVLKMGREEFKKLQSWKQTELKKAVGLF
ncbi:unnamed protein product [Allacma fusca]|uniref:HP domain-containing protein n=1 Tax=Allacma fusca TaxID=39272 RepID=A0A8J2M8E2_9HEXA|nr:unnamed protein product [Allacma fusca]